MRGSGARFTLSGMSRVRAVTAALAALTVLAIVQGGVAAARQPAGSWLITFLIATLLGMINAGLAILVAWKAPANWCAAVLALSGLWLCVAASSELPGPSHPMHGRSR